MHVPTTSARRWCASLVREQGRVGVPEFVPANVRQPRPLEEQLEVAVDDVLSVEGSAYPGGEHKP
jgi:hypothetical protein